MMDEWTRIVEREQPRGQCRGCAFRRGTLANRDLRVWGNVTQILLGGGDFRCHHAKLGGPVVDSAPSRQCRGFAALLTGLTKRFWFAKRLADCGARP